MRDISINELADKVASEFNLKIPKRVSRKLARDMFEYMFKVMHSDKDRLVLRESDLLSIYKDYDIAAICGALAEGKDVPTYESFRKARKLKPIHKKYIRRPMYHNLRKLEL